MSAPNHLCEHLKVHEERIQMARGQALEHLAQNEKLSHLFSPPKYERLNQT